MKEITQVGVDLAKRVIQVQAVGESGKVVVNRSLPREKFVSWCAQLPRSCLVAFETCSGAHHWVRRRSQSTAGSLAEDRGGASETRLDTHRAVSS